MPIMKKRGRPPKHAQVGGATEYPQKWGMADFECTTCKRATTGAASAASVICPDCVQKIADPPESVVKARAAAEVKAALESGDTSGLSLASPAKIGGKPTLTGKKPGFPRCWWLKQLFVGPDGVTYSKGKPITNALPVIAASVMALEHVGVTVESSVKSPMVDAPAPKGLKTPKADRQKWPSKVTHRKPIKKQKKAKKKK